MDTHHIEMGTYKHFKGGTYEVIGVCHHSETLETMVVYKALYTTSDFPKGTLWVRPIALFLEKTNQGTPRFKKIK